MVLTFIKREIISSANRIIFYILEFVFQNVNGIFYSGLIKRQSDEILDRRSAVPYTPAVNR